MPDDNVHIFHFERHAEAIDLQLRKRQGLLQSLLVFDIICTIFLLVGKLMDIHKIKQKSKNHIT